MALRYYRIPLPVASAGSVRKHSFINHRSLLSIRGPSLLAPSPSFLHSSFRKNKGR